MYVASARPMAARCHLRLCRRPRRRCARRLRPPRLRRRGRWLFGSDRDHGRTLAQSARCQYQSELLLLVRTNAGLSAISTAMRNILRSEGRIKGPEVAFSAATPSGQTTSISLAKWPLSGPEIRKLYDRKERLDLLVRASFRPSDIVIKHLHLPLRLEGLAKAIKPCHRSDGLRLINGGT